MTQNYCNKCSATFDPGDKYCRQCGTSLEHSPPSIPADRQEDAPPVDIPDDAVVVRQSNWAWIWATVPWVGLFGVAIAFDFFTFGILPMVFATIVIVPRYLSFRRTAYILTERHVIIQQGSLMGQHRIDLLIADLNDVVVHPGTFGRFLGYTGVNLRLKDGRMASLRYVPFASPLVEHFRARMNP